MPNYIAIMGKLPLCECMSCDGLARVYYCLSPGTDSALTVILQRK